MISYKIEELKSNNRLTELLNRKFKTEDDKKKMYDMFFQFMNEENTFETNLLTQSISYFITILKDDPLELNEPFIKRLMFLLKEKIFNIENRDLSLRLISKMLKYDTEMIESFLNNGLLDFIGSIYPDEYSIKFCTKLSTHRRDKHDLYLREDVLFYKIENYEMNEHRIKIYANFFSSLVKNVSEGLPTQYFDFCHYLVTNFVTNVVPDFKVRNSILKALLTLIQASKDYENEMISRKTFYILKDKIKSNEELKDKTKKEIEEIKETYLFMEDISKQEICNLISIFIILSKNNSEFLMNNNFLDWIFCLYYQNSEFHDHNKKKVLCLYLTFLGDLAFNNPNIFANESYLNIIYIILGNFDGYLYKPKICILRLLYILFDRAPFNIFNQLLNKDIHLILFQYISLTDFSDRLLALQSCLKILKNCPDEKALILCQHAKDDEDFVNLLTGEQPPNDDSQNVADLILQEIHKFDEE